MSSARPRLPIVSTQTQYNTVDGRAVPTFVARPDRAGEFPAILMAYEFYGMLEVPGGGPHMRDVARRFAEEGFVAAVPDYYAAYGKQPTMTGGTISGGPSDEETKSDLQDAVTWLGGLNDVDSNRIGAIGWCGGGRQALLLAAECRQIRAVASFYGRLANRPGTKAPSPIDAASKYRCPVFGAYGQEDHAIPVDTAREFERALASNGVPHEIHIYPGAGHAFMNDQRDSYFAPAAKDAWESMIAFFAKELNANSTHAKDK